MVDEILKWMQNNKDGLSVLGGIIAAIAASSWAIYRFRYEKERDRLAREERERLAAREQAKQILPAPLNPEGNQTMAISEVEALLREREIRLREEIIRELKGEKTAPRPSRGGVGIVSQILRATFGLIMGIVFAPLVVISKVGYFMIALGIIGGIGSVKNGGGFWQGAWILNAFLLGIGTCGVAPLLAIGEMDAGNGNNEVRDSFVGILCGAIVGAGILMAVTIPNRGADISLQGPLSVGAILGALCGFIAVRIQRGNQ